ncbi:MAG: HAMP domain-containing histidine kinase [Candidatus Marinimicrobia bacterium]|nr:HAMP domain-containing histidine kinase [Candidatus Neomarinimicrobiota bacterium]
MLRQSNEFKEMLIDVITHDIKNPAGVISGMAELMIEKQPDNEEIQLISHASENLLDTIKNATTLVQVTLERDISKKEIDLHIIIQDIVKEIASVFEKAGMHLENNITESLIVKANPIIREVFNNYINNALKYATKGNKVIIDHQQNADTITIRVKDYGTTIPESERKRIFDRKIQLTNEIGNGRGLGLAIVSRIAKAHNAEIGVKPNKPTGNIFYIKIPIG